MDGHTGRQVDGQPNRWTDIEDDRWWMNRRADKFIGGCVNRRTDRWTDGRADSQTDLCTDGQLAAGSWQVGRWINNKQTEHLKIWQ